VTTGFTTGIATVIFITQIKDFFGLQIPNPSAECVERLSQYWHYKHTVHIPTVFVAVLSLAITTVCRMISKKIPAAMIAVIGATGLVYLFNIPVETIETKFGAIPHALPSPVFPSFTADAVQAVFPDAVTIALLGAIESLLSCVIADGMTGFRHKSNMELIGQGIANIGSILFGGIPATGAVARTTANIQMGARTPFAGMIHAGTILVFMLLLAPLAGKIPLAALAAILIYIAYNMSEHEHFREILRGQKSEALVLLTTFSLTVLVDLTVSVQAGVLLSIALFLKRITEKTTIKVCKIAQKEDPNPKEDPLWKNPPPPDVEVFEIEGPFFFGVSDLPNEALRLHPTQPKAFILRMRSVPLIDATGAQALKQFHKKCREKGIAFFICEVREDVLAIMSNYSVRKTLGEKQILPSLDDAIQAAQKAVESASISS
jgi:SulP family sulfate permease